MASNQQDLNWANLPLVVDTSATYTPHANRDETLFEPLRPDDLIIPRLEEAVARATRTNSFVGVALIGAVYLLIGPGIGIDVLDVSITLLYKWNSKTTLARPYLLIEKLLGGWLPGDGGGGCCCESYNCIYQ
jgi:hypothetical protein